MDAITANATRLGIPKLESEAQQAAEKCCKPRLAGPDTNDSVNRGLAFKLVVHFLRNARDHLPRKKQ